MLKKYEQIDLSGDVGLKAWGQDLEELFQNAAEGLFTLITDTSSVSDSETRKVHVTAESMDDLLVSWLNELIYIFDAYSYIGKKFSVSIHNNSLKAEIQGGTFDPDRNESRLLIKAATYHELSIQKIDSYWETHIIFDI
jgi:SHS2 domain-containing protein